MVHYHNGDGINLDQFQNGSVFLKKVTIDCKKLSTVEMNVSIFTEIAVVDALFDTVVGSLVGAYFYANDQSRSLNKHWNSCSLFISPHKPFPLHRYK